MYLNGKHWEWNERKHESKNLLEDTVLSRGTLSWVLPMETSLFSQGEKLKKFPSISSRGREIATFEICLEYLEHSL